MDNRKEYAYLLCVGGKILKIIAKWWSTPQEMTATKMRHGNRGTHIQKVGGCVGL